MKNDDKLDIPKGLSKKGRKAAEAILDVLRRDMADMDTGGCRAFYTPKEWKARGESYGLNSVLIVVYDGGCLRPYFTTEDGAYSMVEKMSDALKTVGVWSEECTCWYSAIYES